MCVLPEKNILDQQNQVVAAEYGLLEGAVQTVPRAELRALLAIRIQASKEASVTVRVDASYLVGLRDDPAAKSRADNGDMRVECWRQILSKKLRVD